MSKKFKVIYTIVLSVFELISAVVTGFCFFTILTSPDKYVSNTINVGLQTLADGTARPLVEVQLFDNAFEFKWNYVMDESRTSFYSQGVQLIGDNINFTYKRNDFDKKLVKSKGELWWKE